MRPYSDGDVAAVTAMMNAVQAAGGATRPFSEDIIRVWFGQVADPAEDTRLVLARDGSLAAAGLVSAPEGDGTRVAAIGGVHPGHRGQGLGRALLAWQFERAGAMRPAGAPWLLQTHSGQADESATALFRRLGLDAVRSFLSMRADTAGDRATEVPAGIGVVPYSPDLRDAVHAAHEEAFADHWGHDYTPAQAWSARTTAHPLFRADLSLIGLDGSEVAAYVLAYATAGNDSAGNDSVYYGQIGTRRPWRGQGLASALVSRSLGAAAAAGLPRAALDVDADSPTGAVAVYQRLGFTADPSPSVTYERPL
jgi:mycothiol synthase